MKTQDFLLELGTEELPPKLLVKISSSLKDNIIKELEQLNISTSNVIAYATPRRLAITITELQSKQQDQIIEKKGPSVESADKGIEGFATSCGVGISELEKRSLGNKQYYLYKTQEVGKNIQKKRVLARPNMTKEKFKKILSKQIPNEEKCKRADFVIDTSISIDDARKQVKNIIVKLES